MWRMRRKLAAKWVSGTAVGLDGLVLVKLLKGHSVEIWEAGSVSMVATKEMEAALYVLFVWSLRRCSRTSLESWIEKVVE
jgi:hypothetical protein